jgi:hypothetical protein
MMSVKSKQRYKKSRKISNKDKVYAQLIAEVRNLFSFFGLEGVAYDPGVVVETERGSRLDFGYGELKFIQPLLSDLRKRRLAASDLEVSVCCIRPKSIKSTILWRGDTVFEAERFIALKAKQDPKGVARGDYGIDASEEADAEYQRIKNEKEIPTSRPFVRA